MQMKFNPQRYREGSTQFFGKRGICWHGAAIVFHDSTQLPWAIDAKNGYGRTLYLQDVIENDTTQDAWTALSEIEAVLMFIKKWVPSVQQIVLQSDNGACYASREFAVGLSTMGAVTGVRVCRLIHTEAQDGKSHLDGSFGILSQAIRRYVDENHDITTAAQLASAVRAANAANTVVRLVKVDPVRMTSMAEAVAKSMPDLPTMRKFKDMFYTADGIVCFQYSGVGPAYLIEQADVDKWWTPTTLNVAYDETTQVRQRRRHRQATDSSASSSSSDSEREEALLKAGYVVCQSCKEEVYFARHDPATCVGPRSVQHRAIAIAFQLQASGDVRLPVAATEAVSAAVMGSLALEPRRELAAGWATVSHNTIPMRQSVIQALDAMFASETDRYRCTAQQAVERLEAMCKCLVVRRPPLPHGPVCSSTWRLANGATSHQSLSGRSEAQETEGSGWRGRRGGGWRKWTSVQALQGFWAQHSHLSTQG